MIISAVFFLLKVRGFLNGILNVLVYVFVFIYVLLSHTGLEIVISTWFEVQVI
ncbi:hypothetical protein HanRHA438_Chr01g0023711 [Helianthus annuus]|nr:hypothetical protein HanRHA438_Chr01g0023711 [Helianthus annuus]